ncbi:MAG TPA: nuclear transport factor 2 family protein [Gemmatimonadales bacterium]|nr:nuclear transport factor 2 family protein [Gemmatimonadales bacterium]
MSVELVQELYAAFAQRDIPGMLACLAPDVVWREPENPFNPAAGVHCGHEGFLEWVRIGREAEEIELLEPREFLTNQQTVAVVGYMRCRAKPTGRVYESDFVHLVTCRDGKVIRFQEFFDTYAAGEAFRDTT